MKNTSRTKLLGILIALSMFFALYSVGVAGVGGGSDSCFLPGTKITMADGSKKNIEDVKVGDKVLSLDENLEEKVATVRAIDDPVRGHHYVVSLANGKFLNLTREHPVYAKSDDYEDWAAVEPEYSPVEYGFLPEKLEVGDSLLSQGNEWVEILDIEYKEGDVQTYNLIWVSDTSTFFADGFLAHNRAHITQDTNDYCVPAYGQSCGNCGTVQCDGTCANEGVCSPGETQASSCGFGGTKTKECSSSCQWNEWGSCRGEGVCNPGDLETRPCGLGGQQQRVCNNNYYWNAWSECTEPADISEGTYYCTSGSTFAQDLDDEDRETCEAAGFVWTGSLCCSEEDDPDEFYNDPNGAGGCWDKEFVNKGVFPIKSRSVNVDTEEEVLTRFENVVNINGIFYGCSLNPERNPDNGELLELRDSHTGLQLIQNKNHCWQDEQKNFYCSFINNTWQISQGNDKSHMSSVPENDDGQFVFESVSRPTACCSQSQCWDGTTCIDNQRDNPTAATSGFRCVDGEWTDATLKFTPDGRNNGYCPEESQCLANPDGNSNDNGQVGEDRNPVCINSTQYFDDNYCEGGSWTSRTKFVSLQLIDIAQGEDFVIFCGTPERVLNDVDYLSDGELVEDLVSGDAVNNFCVLKSGEKVIAGTSLNEDIESLNSFLQGSFDVESCEDAVGEGNTYRKCDDSSNVWYNSNSKSLLFSKQTFTVGTPDFLTLFNNFIKNPFETIIRFLQEKVEPFDTSYVEGLDKFNRLYLSKQGNKEIRISLEDTLQDGDNFKNLGGEYSNFRTDICSFVNKYNERHSDESSGIKCSREGDVHYVLGQGSSFTRFDPEDIWADLTSKLRTS